MVLNVVPNIFPIEANGVPEAVEYRQSANSSVSNEICTCWVVPDISPLGRPLKRTGGTVSVVSTSSICTLSTIATRPVTCASVTPSPASIKYEKVPVADGFKIPTSVVVAFGVEEPITRRTSVFAGIPAVEFKVTSIFPEVPVVIWIPSSVAD
jgi:hypothetical protein